LYVAISDAGYSDSVPIPTNFPVVFGSAHSHIISVAHDSEVKDCFSVDFDSYKSFFDEVLEKVKQNSGLG